MNQEPSACSTDDAGTRADVVRVRANRATGESIEFTATARDGDGGVVRFNWRSVPGGAIPEHIHPHHEERFTIIAGEAHLTLGDEKRIVGPGETLILPPLWALAKVVGVRPCHDRWDTRIAAIEWVTPSDEARSAVPGTVALRRRDTRGRGPRLTSNGVRVVRVGPRRCCRCGPECESGSCVRRSRARPARGMRVWPGAARRSRAVLPRRRRIARRGRARRAGSG